jgi:putative drug exporter of the RND superfamily
MNIAPAGRNPRHSPPIVERAAGWSVRHRKVAVFGWLLLVVAAFAVGQHLGTDNLNSL